MKNRIYRAFAILGIVIGLAGADALGQTPSMAEVEIPFEFWAGKLTLKPGVYRVKRSSASVLILRDNRGKSVLLNAPLSVESTDKGERLVFNKYGDKYVLTQVWLTGESGRQLTPAAMLKEKKPQGQIAIRVK